MKSEAILDRIYQFVKAIDPAKRTMKHVVQWNFTDKGVIVKSLVLDFKNCKFYEAPVVGEEVMSEMTIEDSDFSSVFEGVTTFKKLQEENKVKIVGNAIILERMDAKIAEHGLNILKT